MSLKKEAAKGSKSIKKDRAGKKPVPTSAEYILDSDVEANVGAEDPGLSSNFKNKKPDKTLSNKKLKRKAIDVQESSSLKKKRTISPTKNVRTTHRNDIEEVVDYVPNVNGKSNNRTRESLEDSIDSSAADSDPTPAQTNGNGTPTSVASDPSPRQQIKVADPRFTLDVSDSSIIESEPETDDQTSVKSMSSDETEEEAGIVPPSQSIPTVTPPYTPLDGFSIASIDNEGTSQIRSILSQENLNGKHIWHITAPTSVPISEIKTLTPTDILEGKSILFYKGSSYGLNLNDDRGVGPRILLPARKGSKYPPLSRQIDLHLHLRQIIELPNIKDMPALLTESLGSIAGARKAILKQPSGLKMRYRPFGDMEEYENDSQAAQQAKQRIQNTHIPIPSTPSRTSQKSKTSKQSSHSDHILTEWVDPPTYGAPVVIGQDSQHSTVLSFQTPGTSQPDHDKIETKEERAKRKAEKSARKEEKKQRKEARARSRAESHKNISV